MASWGCYHYCSLHCRLVVVAAVWVQCVRLPRSRFKRCLNEYSLSTLFMVYLIGYTYHPCGHISRVAIEQLRCRHRDRCLRLLTCLVFLLSFSFRGFCFNLFLHIFSVLCKKWFRRIKAKQEVFKNFNVYKKFWYIRRWLRWYMYVDYISFPIDYECIFLLYILHYKPHICMRTFAALQTTSYSIRNIKLPKIYILYSEDGIFLACSPNSWDKSLGKKRMQCKNWNAQSPPELFHE